MIYDVILGPCHYLFIHFFLLHICWDVINLFGMNRHMVAALDRVEDLIRVSSI